MHGQCPRSVRAAPWHGGALATPIWTIALLMIGSPCRPLLLPPLPFLEFEPNGFMRPRGALRPAPSPIMQPVGVVSGCAAGAARNVQNHRWA
eukprot:7577686-Pyramimonas_sp.AAC.1